MEKQTYEQTLFSIENRLTNMGRWEERMRRMEETYMTICKIDSQREFVVWLRKLKHGYVSTERGGIGNEMGGKFKMEGIYVYLWLTHTKV